MKNTRSSSVVPRQTKPGLKPADFPLGSVESRAAARAIVQRFTEQEGPQPGDLFIDLTFLTPERAAEIHRLYRSLGESTGTPKQIPGLPRMWLRFPEFHPDSVPDNVPPLTVENAPEDLLWDVIRCHNETMRQVKQAGYPLPPELDPDLVWNGLSYVLKRTG